VQPTPTRGLLPAERLRHSASKLLAAQGLATIVAFATEFLLARALGPNGRGAYALMTATLQIGGLVGSFALAYVAVRDSRQGHLGGRDAVDAVYLGTACASLIVAGLSVIFLVSVYPQLYSLGLAILLFAMVPCVALTNNAKYLLVGFSLSSRSAVLQVLEKVFILVALIVPLVILRGHRWQSAVLALAVATVALGVATVVSMRHPSLKSEPRSSIKVVVGLLRKMISRSARLVPGNIAQFVNYRLDIFLVVALAGTRQGGLYASAATLGSVLLYVSNSASQAVYPVICEEMASGQIPRRTRRAAGLMVAGTVGLALIGIAVAGFVIPLTLGDQYQGSVTPFCILLVAAVPLAAQQMLSGVLMATNRETTMSVIAAASSVVTVVACVILIPSLGAIGAALASLIAYLVSGMATTLLVAPSIGLHIGRLRLRSK
jgi:O-antigen/teichoic acid export membrane protein